MSCILKRDPNCHDTARAAPSVMKDYAAEIDKVIKRGVDSNLQCPYCGKQLKSSSGFTLHRTTCDKIDECKTAGRVLELKSMMQYNGKRVKVQHVKCGLVAIPGGVVAATKLQPAAKSVTKSARMFPPPKTVEEWVDDKYTRWIALGTMDPGMMHRAMNGIYRGTNYAKFRKWTLEEIHAELDKRLGKKPSKKPSKKKK